MPSLGWRKDPEKGPGEKPDFSAGERLRAFPPPPVRASAKQYVMSVLDQGSLGSCVLNSAMQAIRASQIQQGAENPPLGSRLAAYFWCRAWMKETNLDSGTFLRLAFAVTNKIGFCPEDVWPYDDGPDRFKVEPSTEAYRAAYDQRAPSVYERIYESGYDRLDVVKRAVAQGHLVCFGTSVTDAFCRNQGTKELVEPPEATDHIAGGHAMAIVGYDGDDFEIVNSWGRGFGIDGFCWFSRRYIASPITDDLWIVRSAPLYDGLQKAWMPR